MSKLYQKKAFRKSFLILPILFFVLGYSLIFIATAPVLKPVISVMDMIFFDQRVNIDAQVQSLYDKANRSMQNPPEIKASEITFPSYGTHFGHISVENTSVDADVYFGDGINQLKNGVGVYNGSFVPGYGRTTLIAGHNHTYFNGLKNAKIGDTITIQTNYGEYQYEIQKTKVLKATDTSAYDLSKEEENLILYTCYPFDQLGLTPDRYFVYGKYISGPKIILNE